MSQIKLLHSGGNGVILSAPNSNPASDVTLKLPQADGSAGQFMKTDGSGNLSFDAAGGLYASYALLADIKLSSTAGGGTLTSGDWRTRDLNTEISDADGIVSISSNQFTLGAGTYRILANVPSYQTNRHQSALYNVTDSSYVQYGSTEYTGSSDNVNTISILRSRFTISGSKVFEIRHRSQTTETTYGFGVGLGDYWTGNSVCMVLEIFKET